MTELELGETLVIVEEDKRISMAIYRLVGSGWATFTFRILYLLFASPSCARPPPPPFINLRRGDR
jgi:hypothetical protein